MSEENAAAVEAEGSALPEGQGDQEQQQSQEQTQETEGAKAEAGEPEEPEIPKGVKRKLAKLTYKVSVAERERDYYRDLVQRGQQTAQPAQVDETAKTLADFAYDEGKYAQYLVSQAEARAAKTAQQQIEQQRTREQQQQAQQAFEARAEAFAEEVEDYDEVVGNPSLPITPAMADAIRGSEEGPAVAYYLGKNPGIASSLAMLPPIHAAVEIGFIAGKLRAERAAVQKKTVTKAPEPPGKLDGTNSGASVKIDAPESDTLSDAEWARRRNAQIKARRRS